MKWIAKRAILSSNEKMPVAIYIILVEFIDRIKSEHKINLWYSSLKNDDGVPSFRVYFQIFENDEKTILDRFQQFLEQKAEQIGWTRRFFQPEQIVEPSYPHFQAINQACELVLEMYKKYPQPDRMSKIEFWHEIKSKMSNLMSSMDEKHHKEFIHFIANNLAICDNEFVQKIRA